MSAQRLTSNLQSDIKITDDITPGEKSPEEKKDAEEGALRVDPEDHMN
jgi:hypothetical protein